MIKIEEESQSRFVIITEIKSKIKLIYDSKLKLMLQEDRLGEKTCNLSQIYTQSNPINYLIQGFSFHDFENEF